MNEEPVEALRTELESQLSTLLARLRTLGYPLRRVPRVEWNLRGMAAGQAHPLDDRIRLNGPLLAQEGAHFAQQTLVHELCHLAVWARHGRRARPHGPEWRGLMRAMGASAQRCHAAQVTPARRQRRFRYACGCGEQTLSTTRHRRAQQGVRYLCRRCHHVMRPIIAADGSLRSALEHAH